MSDTLKGLLIIASVLTVGWILRKIRKNKVKMEDAIFWIFFAAILLLLAIFPEISYELCRIFGIMSPSNLVFLVIIFLLVEKIFTLSIIVSQLEDKIGVLSAEVALRSKAENKKIDKVDEKETLLEREEVEKQEIEAEIGIGEGRLPMVSLKIIPAICTPHFGGYFAESLFQTCSGMNISKSL